MSAVAPLPIPDPDDEPGPALEAVIAPAAADLSAWSEDQLVAEVTAVERASRAIAARAARLAVEFSRRHPERSGKEAEDDLSLAALDELSVASGLARGRRPIRGWTPHCSSGSAGPPMTWPPCRCSRCRPSTTTPR